MSKLIAVAALLGSSMAMAAQIVVVSPSTATPLIGNQFTVTLQMTGGTNIGGGTFTVNWDNSKASLATAALPGLGDGPVATGTGSFLINNNPTFDLLPGSPPVNGNFNFAVLTFNALAAGAMNLVVADDGGIFSGWFDNDTAEPIPTSYQNANINITGAVVPVPAAAWLLISALGSMVALKRRPL
jgi:hypothetical protein